MLTMDIKVIYKIPAYVGSVKDILASAVTSITGVSGYTEILQQFITDNKMTRVQLVMDGSNATSNSVTDFLYALSPSQRRVRRMILSCQVDIRNKAGCLPDSL